MTSRSRSNIPGSKDWESYRAIICQLYLDENRSLDEVRSILKDQHGFEANARSFKARLHQWHFTKNVPQNEMKAVVRSLMEAKGDDLITRGGDRDVCEVDGQTIRLSQAKRFLKRNGVSMSGAGSLDDSTSLMRSSLSDCEKQTTISQTHSTKSLTASHLSHPEPATSDHTSKTKDNLENQSIYPFNDIENQISLGNAESGAFKLAETAPRKTKRAIKSKEILPRWPTPESSIDSVQRFACPFYKHSPKIYAPRSDGSRMAATYRSCAGPGWKSVTRIREHLHRVHSPRHSIKRDKFAVTARSEGNLSTHNLPDLHSEPEVGAVAQMSQWQIEETRRMKKRLGESEELYWGRVYTMLFPGEAVPRPYYESKTEALSIDHFTGFEHYLQRELPKLVQEALTERMAGQLSPLDEAVSSELQDIVRRCVSTAMTAFAKPGQRNAPQTWDLSKLLEHSSRDTLSSTMSAGAADDFNCLYPIEADYDSFLDFEAFDKDFIRDGDLMSPSIARKRYHQSPDKLWE